MKLRRRISAAIAAMVAGATLAGAAHGATFQDALVQAPTVSTPQRGSLAGSLSRLAFGPGELARGTYGLPLPIEVPGDRGALLVGVIPSYSPEGGQSEWGMGWQSDLAIRRYRHVGELDYATDGYTSPWGRLVAGDDGSYYPTGLGRMVRVTPTAAGGWLAELADGARYRFDVADAVTTPRGTYAWMLSRVDSVVGDATTLTWTRNASGRPFLAEVRWGGRGDGTQYRLAFAYGPVARPYVSYASGTRLVLDQQVTLVIVSVKQGSSYAERWRYDLSYQASPTGPASYLRQIVRTQAGAAGEPAVVYAYDLGTERLATARFAHVPALDGFLAAHGGGALQPDRAAMTDLEQNGLIDLETHDLLETVRQTETGFVVEGLPAADGTDPRCRPAPSSSNRPRVLARMHGDAAAPQVVATSADGVNTRILLCDRLGVPVYQQVVSGPWRLGANTRLADVDRDQRPDLIRATAGRVEVLRNTATSPTALGFAPGPVTTLTPAVTPVATWLLDQNGDGRADLMMRHAGGVVVWLGISGGTFESAGSAHQFVDTAGRPISSFGLYDISHGDFNGDGLSDAVLSRNGSAWLYTNRGGSYVATAMPGLQAMPGGGGFPLVADLTATGNDAVVVVAGTRAHALDLTEASTGLLRTADDGRGTLLTFGYGRVAPAAGVIRRYSTLASLTVASSGYDPVTYTYGYGAPVVHSTGKFLVGFSSTLRQSPQSTEQLQFANDDDVAAVPLLREDTDARTPGVVRFEQRAYDAAIHHGVPWRRPASVERGHRGAGGGPILSTITRYPAFQRGVCATEIRTEGPSGTLIETVGLATIAAIPDALHCLPASKVMLGVHADADLDFLYTATSTRNELGQVTRVTQAASPLAQQVLQEVTYDDRHRLASVTTPGQGTTVVGYDDVGRVEQVTTPVGVAERVVSFDPVTDAIREVQRGEPGLAPQFSYRYDGRGRLTSSWDDHSGTSAALPAAQYDYRDATATQPGAIETTTLADAGGAMRRQLALLAADGELLLTATQLEDPAPATVAPLYRIGPVTVRERATGATQTRRAAPRTGAELRALTSTAVRALGTLLNEHVSASFGHVTRATTTQQEGVIGTVTTEVLLQPGALVTRIHQADGAMAEVARDAAGQLVRRTDELGVISRYRYDAMGRLVRAETPDGVQAVTFDAFGRPADVTRDGLGAVRYTYDPVSGLPAIVQRVAPGGAVVQASVAAYDAAGRTSSVVRTAGTASSTLTYHYDGDLGGAAPAPGQLGRLSGVEGDGWRHRTEYDLLGRPIWEQTELSGWRTVTNERLFYPDGTVQADLMTVADAAGAQLTVIDKQVDLDEAGRVSAVYVNGEPLYGLSYDVDGSLAQIELFPTNEAVSLETDPVTQRRRAYTLVNDHGGVGGVRWHFDPRGHVSREAFEHGGVVRERSYAYDGRGVLTAATTPDRTDAYTYTASGLPDTITDLAGTRTVHRTGAELTVGGVTYAWDDAGRVVRKGDWTLVYGASGQLEHASRPGRTLDFIYDERDHRLLKRVDGVPVRADVAGGVLTAQGFVEIVAVEGVVLGVLENGVFTSLLTDPRGTAFGRLDGTFTLASAYGLRAIHLAHADVVDFARLGWDADLDVVRMGVRDYDANLAQFWTPDPLYLANLEACQSSPLQCGLYGYAGGNPLTNVDPSGTDAGGAQFREDRLIRDIVMGIGNIRFDDADQGSVPPNQEAPQIRAAALRALETLAKNPEGRKVIEAVMKGQHVVTIRPLSRGANDIDAIPVSGVGAKTAGVGSDTTIRIHPKYAEKERWHYRGDDGSTRSYPFWSALAHELIHAVHNDLGVNQQDYHPVYPASLGLGPTDDPDRYHSLEEQLTISTGQGLNESKVLKAAGLPGRVGHYLVLPSESR